MVDVRENKLFPFTLGNLIVIVTVIGIALAEFVRVITDNSFISATAAGGSITGLAILITSAIIKIESVNPQIKKIDEIKTMVGNWQNHVYVEYLDTVVDYYTKLQDNVVIAKKKVRNTFLGKISPDEMGEGDMRRIYYDTSLEIAKKKATGGAGSVAFIRIIRIESMEVLKWVDKLVNIIKDNKLVDYHIAYVNMEAYGKNQNNTISSWQIIDDSKVFRMDYRRHLDGNDTLIDGIYMENKNMCQHYQKKYDDLWKQLADQSCPFGCIIISRLADYYNVARPRILADMICNPNVQVNLKKDSPTQLKEVIDDNERLKTAKALAALVTVRQDLTIQDICNVTGLEDTYFIGT